MALYTVAASKSFVQTTLHSVVAPSRPLLPIKALFHRTHTRSSAQKTGKMRLVLQPIRATSEETSNDVLKSIGEVLGDWKETWDSIENKSTVFVFGAGAVAALWISSTLPKVMELIGLSYSLWFTYRYLLFKESRKELAANIEELKQKVTGTEDD
ncbi:protein CURVATURE THYLAKOID 1A, chloroplastic isoform X2 [Cryptomeria japonica]|uniref:protein CURVATURE THYLAKOID 1A, chloroplastic isoform X2 n=1 Tax=Cryptomeria japonica TaxID=3369 RepID=UPI0025AD4AA6|nr:protein CURVATURE THYLAKOID 1A, chloroplastic isoform X2 [Cryptomeria japonica]